MKPRGAEKVEREKMATDRGFTHPNFGTQARVEQFGREVRIVFIAANHVHAESLAETILSQMKNGAINITMMGKPTSVTEETHPPAQSGEPGER